VSRECDHVSHHTPYHEFHHVCYCLHAKRGVVVSSVFDFGYDCVPRHCLAIETHHLICMALQISTRRLLHNSENAHSHIELKVVFPSRFTHAHTPPPHQASALKLLFRICTFSHRTKSRFPLTFYTRTYTTKHQASTLRSLFRKCIFSYRTKSRFPLTFYTRTYTTKHQASTLRLLFRICTFSHRTKNHFPLTFHTRTYTTTHQASTLRLLSRRLRRLQSTLP
jgi:hypothetical protein